jgi:hypothetical protein
MNNTTNEKVLISLTYVTERKLPVIFVFFFFINIDRVYFQVEKPVSRVQEQKIKKFAKDHEQREVFLKGTPCR